MAGQIHAAELDGPMRELIGDLPAAGAGPRGRAALDGLLPRRPPLGATEAELLPPLCAVYWLTSACAKVPRDASEVEGGERMVHFMRYWLDGAVDLGRALRP